MTELEYGCQAFAFASGMAAIHTILELLSPEDHIIAGNDLYGGTYRLFQQVKQRSLHLDFDFVNTHSLEPIQAAKQAKTKLLWLETPSNPLLNLSPLEEIAAWAKANQIITVVDNTFASPWIQNPLQLGCDIVIHSATKYLNGHSDVVGGIVIVGDEPELCEKLAFLQNSCGAIASPFDSYLVLRSLKTLAIRMQKHCDNAHAIAQYLESHPLIERVIYPGLPSHPQHALAKRQMRHFGGMISMIIKPNPVNFLKHCELFTLAESLGGVESLIEHPATMTHASIPTDVRKKIGIDDHLVRLSVGIEHLEDLKVDLAQALERA
jgi:cystathionine beta-lyase/cystathionine gamma-synthase